MNQYTLSILAILGGVFLAAQGGFNSSLGVVLRNPFLASVVAFFFSTFFAILFLVFNQNKIPNISVIKSVPLHLWFTGGLLSVIGISIYYYTIPKLGISTMISLGLFGQLTFSIIAGHFGWLNLPIEPLSIKKALGFLSMLLGILLINIK